MPMCPITCGLLWRFAIQSTACGTDMGETLDAEDAYDLSSLTGLHGDAGGDVILFHFSMWYPEYGKMHLRY